MVEALKYVYEAITLTRHELKGKVPLIGFSGAPVRLNKNNLKNFVIYIVSISKVDFNVVYD